MSDFQDLEIRCSDCGASFPFKATEQAFFAERDLTPPKRCKDCRAARKQDGGGAARGAGGPSRDGGRDGARGPARGPRGAGGPGSYDRGGPPGVDRHGPPRSSSFGAGAGGAAARDRKGPPRDAARGPAPSFAARGPRTREDGSPSRDHSAPTSTSAPRGETKNFDPRDSRAGRVSPGPRAGGPGGAPFARPGQVREPKWGRPQHAFADSSAQASAPREDRDSNSGSGADESNARAPKAAGPKKEKRPRSEGKQRFPVTCQTCGTTTDVPFEPIAGRPIFCQPCYRARRGTTEGGASASESGSGSNDRGDVGIVE